MRTGRYRHYKGMEYTVVDVARHSETMEEMVVYRAEYGERGLWVRPRTMFEEWIKKDDEVKRRFACEEPPFAWPQSLRLRVASSADAATIRMVHEEAFPATRDSGDGSPEAHLVEELTAGGWGELSLLASIDERPVGHLLLSRLDVRTEAGQQVALALAPVAVLPRFQRQGIGTALVRASLDVVRQKGWASVFVLGEPRFYERFGFRHAVASDYACVYQGEAFQALELTPGGLPADPAEICFPTPFSRL